MKVIVKVMKILEDVEEEIVKEDYFYIGHVVCLGRQCVNVLLVDILP